VISANPSQSGGSSDVAFFNGKLYFANQTGASVSVASLSGSTLGAISTVKAELGARAIAVDVKDNLLVVSNEGTGNLTLIDLSSNKVVGHINAVKTDMQGDDGGDDHSDRN
jgi:DNA-binding beta-propeller fold protein YncE